MRSPDGDNHHDLGLFSVGPDAPRPPRGSTGLYHLAWEVPTIDDLAVAARVLSEAGALGGSSDHGVSKSLYGADPDGNEFEIMWRVPREAWGEYADKGVVLPLDLDAEVRRWGAAGAARPDVAGLFGVAPRSDRFHAISALSDASARKHGVQPVSSVSPRSLRHQ